MAMMRIGSRLPLAAAFVTVLVLQPASSQAQLACPPTGSFSDDFEPSAMVGWQVDSALNLNVASPNWMVVPDPGAHSLTNSFSSDSTGLDLKDDRLVAPPQDLSSSSQLIFWHRHNFENSPPDLFGGDYDGGLLEVSTDNGASWVDVPEANFVTGGYNATIRTNFNSPIAGRRAWSNASTGFPNAMNEVRVNLGNFAGSDVKVRWRLALDELAIGSLPGAAWWVDDVQFTNLVVNCAPVAVDDIATTVNGFPVTINVLANDTDANGDPLTVTSVTDPPNGTAVNNGDGTVTYTPDCGFFGNDTFGYTISDGQGGTDTGLVTVRNRKTSRRGSIPAC
jgi:hypothetical protein